MSTFNEIEITTPYGDTDNVLELNIDASSDAYVLQNVIKLPSTYTFSIWYRTESDSQITFNVLGESETVNSTTSWNKFVKTVTVETLDETSIYIIPSVGVNSYFYEGYLAEGITDTSWLPAPEDVEGEIGSVRSELIQTAESILLKVSDSNGRITTLETNLEGITGRVEDAEGNISKVSQTVDSVTTEISDAKGSYTSLKASLEGIQNTVTQGYTDAIQEAESNFIQRADSIEERVETNEGTITSHEISIGNISGKVQDNAGNITQMQQTLNGLDVEIQNARGDKTTLSAKIGEISQNVSNVEGKYSSLSSTVNGVEINVGSLQDLINKSFEFTDEGLIIKSSGTSNSNISLKLGNDRISFLDGTNEVAYISNNKLHITSASIVDSMQIGGFAFMPMPNGSLSFNKI